MLPVERGDQFTGVHLIRSEHLCFDIPELVCHGFAYRHLYCRHYAAAEHRRDLHLDADTARRDLQPLDSTSLARRSRYLCTLNHPTDLVRNPAKAVINCPERIIAIVQRQVGEIDIHGQAREITDKEVDCRATFQRKARFGGNQW